MNKQKTACSLLLKTKKTSESSNARLFLENTHWTQVAPYAPYSYKDTVYKNHQAQISQIL